MSGPNERDEIAAMLARINRPHLRESLIPVEAVSWLPFADAFLASDWLAERDRRTAATAVREALGSDEEPDMLRAMLHDAADRLANPRHRGNEHSWPKHAEMFRHLAGRIEADQ